MTENEFLRELVAALMKQNAELLAQVASANEQITAANAQIAVLTERIEELLEQLDKNGVGFFDAIKAALTGTALPIVAQWG